MILTSLISFILLLTPTQNPNNTFYNYGANIEATQQIEPLVDDSGYYYQSTLKFNANISYDDAESYYLNNFSFNLIVKIYEALPNGDRYLETTKNLVTNFDWEITPSSYYQNFENLKFTINNNEDDFYISSYYNNNLQNQISYVLDGTPANNNMLTITINNDIFSQIENWLNLNMYNENSINESYNDGYTAGYQSGYTTGYTEGSNQDETAVAIFSGIIEIALVPINFFLAMLNFEVFGINIGAFVSALLTVAIVVIIIRIVVSGGNKNG